MPALFNYLSIQYSRYAWERVSLVELCGLVALQLLKRGLSGHSVINCGAETKQILLNRQRLQPIEVRLQEPCPHAC
jgi:hypothetical protein